MVDADELDPGEGRVVAEPAQDVTAAAAQVHDTAKGATRPSSQAAELLADPVRHLHLLTEPLQLGVHAPHERLDVPGVEDVVRGRQSLDEPRCPLLPRGAQPRRRLRPPGGAGSDEVTDLQRREAHTS
ncbi:hypothetical protein [Janibacter anophelis]|uniref:hypothetical protein n=1 Tax=Janibacter anophelis TaxID=319054 RepID=UPI0013B04C29|nr:hypothetical protein [Janibacter anophelis]